MEQHGPHLPLATDNIWGYELPKRVAGELGNALVAPVISPGYSEYHMGFPGTLSISLNLLKALIHEHVESLALHRFKTVIILPVHGGNFGVVRELLPELQLKYRRKLKVITYTDFEELEEVAIAPARRAGISEDEIGGYAEVWKTSFMLAIRSDMINSEEIKPGFVSDLNKARRMMCKRGMKFVSDTGVFGNPTHATAEMGAEGIGILAQRIADYVKDKLGT